MWWENMGWNPNGGWYNVVKLSKVESNKFLGGWGWCEAYVLVIIVFFLHCLLCASYVQLLFKF
jgi:hypothetical protein